MPEGVIQVPFRTKDVEQPSQIVPVNADGTPKPQPPKRIEFKRFENGMVLGFSQNPRKQGTYAIHDATGTTYALALHPAVADLICQAVTALFLMREQKAKEQAAQLDTLSEAVVDSHSSGGTTEPTPTPAL